MNSNWISRESTGSIEVVCGPMFSGKTEELIRRARRAEIAKQNVLIFKPDIDNRYDNEDEIASHSGIRFTSATIRDIDHGMEIYTKLISKGKRPHFVGIEEVQFFEPEIVERILALKESGTRVVVAGLDMDWRGKPFQITAEVLALADKVEKLKAVCMTCGADASHTYKKNKTSERIQVGGTNEYEVRCYEHWRNGTEKHRNMFT